MTNKLIEEFDDLGVVIGWYSETLNAKGEKVRVFIPRRDEDIEADRASLKRIK